MAFLNFGKKAPQTPPPADAPVIVLGSGCKTCHAQLENVQAALDAMGLPIRAALVTDPQVIMAHGVMSMPAIVANGRVIAAGRLVKPDEAEQLLRGAGL